MSVTKPTLKFPPLDEPPEDEPPPPLELLLLLLPHAAKTSASATIASAPRPTGLILLPLTASPFERTDGATLVWCGDGRQ